jgi:hypothetical protein
MIFGLDCTKIRKVEFWHSSKVGITKKQQKLICLFACLEFSERKCFFTFSDVIVVAMSVGECFRFLYRPMEINREHYIQRALVNFRSPWKIHNIIAVLVNYYLNKTFLCLTRPYLMNLASLTLTMLGATSPIP